MSTEAAARYRKLWLSKLRHPACTVLLQIPELIDHRCPVQPIREQVRMYCGNCAIQQIHVTLCRALRCSFNAVVARSPASGDQQGFSRKATYKLALKSSTPSKALETTHGKTWMNCILPEGWRDQHAVVAQAQKCMERVSCWVRHNDGIHCPSGLAPKIHYFIDFELGSGLAPGQEQDLYVAITSNMND